jgi:ABC-2 type transport system permease protein
MNLHVVFALVQRYTYLYKRSPPRVFEIVFWPVMDLLVWGFLTQYLLQAGEGVPAGITFLIGALIFWDILYRSQQGVTLSFLEDIWSRNLLNIFVAPTRVREFLAATYLVGFIKIAITSAALTGLAYWLYQFNLFSLGPALVPFFINLLLMGWAMGMFTTALILRWGQAAEALAWGVPFLIQPLAAVFYPVEILPAWLQPISFGIPATHVFEGMRQVLQGGGFSWDHLVWAFGLNAVYLVVASLFFQFMFQLARRQGLLARLGTQ